MPVVQQFENTAIADHAFSDDRSLLAVAQGTKARLFLQNGHTYQQAAEFADHDKTVTSVDVSCNGRVVTCSQDRNALVWEPQVNGTWRPTLVLLRINRAATKVRWAPDESKFAVGSSARTIAVCYFEPENDWWVSKHIKKPLRSTVLSVSWHPNCVLLACGSTDGHARIFSGYVKGIDQKPAPTPWGERVPFNTLCGDFVNSSGGWVQDVAFSPSGELLAFVTHDSSVVIVYPSGPDQPPRATIEVSTSFLSFMSLLWVLESEIVTAGHDCHPIVFKGSHAGWEYAGSLDDPGSARGAAQMGQRSALEMFKQLDLKGSATHSASDTRLPTIHQNSIVSLRPFQWNPQGVLTRFSSTGLDGTLVIFDLSK